MKKNAFLLIALILVSGCINIQRHSGKIRKDTIWSGNIVLDGDVYVQPGVKLTILEGTKVLYSKKKIRSEFQRIRNLEGGSYDVFHENKIELIVAGDIFIKGTEEKPVVFTAPTKNSERANGIVFIGYKSSSTITHAIINGGNMGIRLYDDRAPMINNVTITDIQTGAIGCWDRAKPTIVGAEVYENKYGIGASGLVILTI